MTALRSILFEWDLSRVVRVAVSGVAITIALRVTDDPVIGLGVASVLAVALDIPWYVYSRDTQADG
jgi:hypothetical protein